MLGQRWVGVAGRHVPLPPARDLVLDLQGTHNVGVGRGDPAEAAAMGTRAAVTVTAWGCRWEQLALCLWCCESHLTSLPEAFSMAWTICRTE